MSWFGGWLSKWRGGWFGSRLAVEIVETVETPLYAALTEVGIPAAALLAQEHFAVMVGPTWSVEGNIVFGASGSLSAGVSPSLSMETDPISAAWLSPYASYEVIISEAQLTGALAADAAAASSLEESSLGAVLSTPELSATLEPG